MIIITVVIIESERKILADLHETPIATLDNLAF